MIKFNLHDFTEPIWKGDTVYAEMFLPLDRYGEDELTIALTYPIDEVISLCDGRLEKEFAEGKDFFVKNGNIVIPKNSAMAFMPWNEFNLDHIQEGSPFHIVSTEGGWLFFACDNELSDRCFTVKYKHGGVWDGVVPSKKDGSLPNFTGKLRRGEPVTIAFFGDSITYGCNSTSLSNTPPYVPVWCKMICERISEMYGNEVNYINRAVGGTTSEWGAEQCAELFKDDKPDLFVIAFGMNDGVCDKVAPNTEKIIEAVEIINPECEFVLVSTMLPHEMAAGFYVEQYKQEPLLAEVAAMHGDKAVLAPMTSVHTALLKRKRYFDMTGNNVNHPNDFLASVYAQTVIYSVCETE